MTEFDYGKFRMAFLIAALVNNITEATFKAVSIVWFFFILIGMNADQPSEVQGEGTETGKV